MKTLEIHYPDSLADVACQSQHAFQKDLRMALSTKLFEMGKITSGQAAEIVGISRFEFLMGLHTFGVNAVAWDLEELRDELQNA